MKKYLSALVFLAAASLAVAASQLVYIGTYTNAGGQGIYATRFDSDTGALSKPFLAGAMNDPSFLAFGQGHRFLYAIDENGSKVEAFTIERDSGKLTLINQQPTGGSSTAHLVVDPSFRMLIVANYGGGTVSTFPLNPDGSIGPRQSLLEQRGPHGPDRVRQTQARPHSITLSPDGKFAFVCDLGLDRIFDYRLDPAKALLVPVLQFTVRTPPGSGPRHSVFSPDGRFFYVINEMGGSVTTFAYDVKYGRLVPRGTISSLPANFAGVKGSAEIAISPDGLWLYASNRGSGKGSNSLAVFAREPKSGRLKLKEVVPSGGEMPRNFVISPDGKWLLCAHQNTNNIVSFRLDSATGHPTPTGHEITVSRAVCLLFLP